MASITLTRDQLAVIEAEASSKLFLAGPAGTGKSVAGVERLKHLLAKGVRGDSILVFTPQRTLQAPYLEAIQSPDRIAGGEVTCATVGGLARRMLELFWPLAARQAGFRQPERPPVFLTLETAQYYLAHVVRPLVDQGYFESVTIDRNRLYSQILDNLNKSAAVGFPYTEIGSRLDSAWTGDPAQRRIYFDAQDCATRFREFCLRNNLLDFSLQLEVFWVCLWSDPVVQAYLTNTYQHLIYDNLEEDVPRAHDLMRAWLPKCRSALLIYDEGGGYRRFLGADTDTAYALRGLCDRQVTFRESLVMSEGIARLAGSLADAIAPTSFPASAPGPERPATIEATISIVTARFYPELLDALVARIGSLLEAGGLSASEIVVLSPYLSDALRFAITSRLEARGIPWRTHRPSRSLHDEPAARTLLTLAALAHPYWNIRPSKYDVGYALKLAVEMDLVRAQLLAEIVYRTKDASLSPFSEINTDKQERITFTFGNRYSKLREWILKYRAGPPLPLDHFLRRFFGEVLSQPGFGFHRNPDAARIGASLIESVRKFRLALEPSLLDLDHPDFDFGREYIALLQEGVIAAQYLESWKAENEQAVLVAPAYTFLVMNRPARIQFWLDIGSSGWYERLDQPLTHPQVLSREWPAGRPWTFADEEQTNRQTMARLVSGLLHRCRDSLYLGISNLGESGFEQRGELLRAFQDVLASRQDH
ncbi:MAG TPA: UvrD-helicase domain-containing protein [Anaerolineales bacterium]|nr:UvrD-helicase domain-containing protein [Anaerolineales bacterium]